MKISTLEYNKNGIYLICHIVFFFSYDSETVDSFHKNLTTSGTRLAPIEGSAQPNSANRGKPDPSPSDVARQMIEDERESAVFRQGDYNVTRKYMYFPAVIINRISCRRIAW